MSKYTNKELLKLSNESLKNMILKDKLTQEQITYLIEHDKITIDMINYFIEKDVTKVRDLYYDYLDNVKYEYINSLQDEKTPGSFADILAGIGATAIIRKDMMHSEKRFKSNVLDIISKYIDKYYVYKDIKNLGKKYNRVELDYIKDPNFQNKLQDITNRLKINNQNLPLDYSDILSSEKRFKDYILKRYNDNYDTIRSFKSRILKKDYIANLVSKFENNEKIIPYFLQNGKIRYNTLATYNSMVYNTNLTNDAWEMTKQSAKEMGKDEFVVIGHPYCCGNCAVHNAKVYTEQELDEAIADGLKHPNCKCVIAIFFDKSQIPNTNYDTTEWLSKYHYKQKINALDLKKKRLRNDLKIYDSIGYKGEMYDQTKQKINAINKRIREQKNIIDKTTEFFAESPDANIINYSKWIEQFKPKD